MRINTNIASLNAQNSLAKTGAAAAKTIGRLSSGFRINSAADDAAGLGIANKLRAETRALKQAARNAEQANSMLQIMEGAASKIGDILVRMKELATQGASDNVGTEGRTAITAELTQLHAEIDRIVSTTVFQGDSLLSNEATDRTFLVSSSGAYDAEDTIKLEKIDLSATTLNIDGVDVDIDGDPEVVELADLADREHFAAFLKQLDSAIDTVNGKLGSIGAAQNRLDFATQNVRTTIENFSAAESTIRDADMAAEMSTFTQQQILQQAGVAMLAQANSAPQQILRLLQ